MHIFCRLIFYLILRYTYRLWTVYFFLKIFTSRYMYKKFWVRWFWFPWPIYINFITAAIIQLVDFKRRFLKQNMDVKQFFIWKVPVRLIRIGSGRRCETRTERTHSNFFQKNKTLANKQSTIFTNQNCKPTVLSWNYTNV